MQRLLLILVILIYCDQIYAQKTLEITKSSITGGLKILKVKNYEVLEYKIVGQRKFRKDKIVNLQDSIISFENGNELYLREIGKIKIRTGGALVAVFQHLFIAGGILFFSLSAVNNVIVPSEPVITETVVIVSASLITAGFLIKQLGIKRIKVNKRVRLRIVNIDFQNLNSK